MDVGLLSIEQKELITGQLYDPDSYFNPVQDYYDNWVLSVEEMNDYQGQDFIFVKSLPIIEYVPKIIPFPPI